MSKIKCLDCPYHRLDNDRDPVDWFNDDDEILMCTKVENNVANSSDGITDTYHSGYRTPFKVIEGMLRPYETKKVEQPDWCPLLKKES